ncbi:Gfo/Idh/MocA family oxidoreductase [Rhodoblastus acidophilus]|uniref:Gfo/Idh/MocA family oxidoreductase n=1 Tax=Candidatus Rhodoblastus alkanivorans TaxID=2954117 RepID=A0ABS9ZC73_9HYPH|nr:Gfo/Idh/MocA family oxidoreductase [Candidatus Rhodoblastus alkanivorans]MCI4684885.1 Gfo/Idh/MocA family oxidoreductase [Candidatus Rhodoblastus alkanivorans]MDI4642209.1 Gfo/Idh/MocA family oxidoreductase [Rhodoblastus acidophilus]
MTINISVIGLGPWGHTLANKLSALPDFALKSTYDHHDGRKMAHAEAAPSLDAILEDRSIEACVVTTPNHTHADLALTLLEAGKNVLIAKPLAMTSAACDEVAALARAKGLVAMTGHTTLFNPGVLLMKRLIAETGRPVLHYDARRRGVGRIQKNSVLLDLAVHDVANAIFVTGQHPLSARHVQRAYGGCAAAQAQMFLAFEGGMTGHVESSWVASERRRLAVATLDGKIVKLDELTAKVSVYDTTPVASLANENFSAVKTAEYKIDAHDALADELSTFARFIRDGGFPEENARIARSVVHAIEISQDLGAYP